MTKSAEFVINGLTVAGLTIAALSCTDNEGQQSINPSQSPLSGTKTEATLEAPPTYDTRLQTPAETAVIMAAATATRMPETPTTAPATKTPFPPTKVPDTATAVPPTKAPDTATAVATAPATAAATAPAVIAEGEKFPSNGVYTDEDTFVATLPDRRIIIASVKDQPECSNGYRVFQFITATKYDPKKDTLEFNDPNGVARVIGLSYMSNTNKFMVFLKEKGHQASSPNGKINCPASEVSFKVSFEGASTKDRILANARRIGAVSRVDEIKALQQLESIVGPLP